MRRHAIRTTKILAMALTAAGCASNATTPPATTAAAIVAIEDAPAVEKSAAAEVKEVPEAKPSVALSDEEIKQRAEKARDNDDPKLLALRAELRHSPEYEYNGSSHPVAAANPRYRPLCDAEGYPLVGNVLNKSGGVSVTHFCQDVRTATREET